MGTSSGSAVRLAWAMSVSLACPLHAVEINVTSRTDVLVDDGVCTLREAVIAANEDVASGATVGECPAGAGTDKIVLVIPGTYHLAIQGTGEDQALTGDLDLTEDLEIEGGDATTHVIDAAQADRVVEIHGSLTAVAITGVTITGGQVSPGDGGGIRNEGTLTVNDSVIAGNRAHTNGGGIYHSGPALTLSRTVVQTNTALRFGGNRRGSDNGGGLYLVSSGLTQIDQCVFTANVARNDGGGIDSTNGSLTATNTTFHHNLASRGDALSVLAVDVRLDNVTFDEDDVSWGSGLFNQFSSVTLANTLVAGRCDGDALITAGGNIESPGNTCTLTDASDQSGIPSAALNLEPLQDNGGPTPTQVPGMGSVALEGGVLAHCPLTDQRGIDRPQDFDGVGGADCDVGAVELTPCPLDQTIDIDNDSINGVETFEACARIDVGSNVEIVSPGMVTLRSGDLVTFADGFQVGDEAKLTVDVRWSFWDNVP